MADKDVLELPDELDRLLRQELAIEPSSSFAARVRRHVSEQPQPSPWWRARWIPALGSLATVASIAWALAVPAVVRWTRLPVPPPAPAARATSIHHPSVDPTLVFRTEAARSTLSSTPSTAAMHRDAPPEVLVDGRQRAALSTLLRMMERGSLTAESFAATVPVSLEPIADHLGEITIAPVVVSAMAPGGVLHNDEH